jgi:hypothetical protein
MAEVTVALERVDDRGRWVRVTLALYSCPPGLPDLEADDPLAWDVSPADRLAAARAWRDWAEVVRDALEYVWRPYPAGRVALRSVRGVLGDDDRAGLALACTLALRRLLGDAGPELPTALWRLRE